MHVREGLAADGPAIAAIRAASPEAAQWEPSDYPLLIAEVDGRIAGFLVWRQIIPGEAEILNLAVDVNFRRRGVARGLLAALPHASVSLEVRESNYRARSLYGQAGFHEAGVRFGYYHDPAETAIVMRWQK